MTTSKVHDLSHFALALASGIVGNALLKDADWGLNLSLWLLMNFALVYYLRKRNDFDRPGVTIWIALGFSFLFLWRDSAVLQGLALGSITIAICLTPLGSRKNSLTLPACFGGIVDSLFSVCEIFYSRLPVAFTSLREKEVVQSPTVARVVRGLLLSTIPVFIFGLLFMSADEVFESKFFGLFTIDPLSVVHSGVIILVLTIAGCFILYTLTCGPVFHCDFPKVEVSKSFGSIEINVVLGVINLLFLAFVYIQLGYFFAGHDLVQSTTGPSYAEYAQRGFYELGAVAVLSFSMLVAFEALIPRHERRAYYVFMVLTQMHIVLVAVVIASAFHRMALYVDAYGLTLLRLYATVGVLWLIAQFAGLFVAMCLERGTLVSRLLVYSAFGAVFVLYCVNPDGLVARINIERVAQGKEFDAEYAATLSDDAIPELARGLEKLSEKDQSELRYSLSGRATSSIKYREFSYSRVRASRSLGLLGFSTELDKAERLRLRSLVEG